MKWKLPQGGAVLSDLLDDILAYFLYSKTTFNGEWTESFIVHSCFYKIDGMAL